MTTTEIEQAADNMSGQEAGTEPDIVSGEPVSQEKQTAIRRHDIIQGKLTVIGQCIDDITKHLRDAHDDGDHKHLGYETFGEYAAALFSGWGRWSEEVRLAVVPVLRELGASQAETAEAMGTDTRTTRRDEGKAKGKAKAQAKPEAVAGSTKPADVEKWVTFSYEVLGGYPNWAYAEMQGAAEKDGDTTDIETQWKLPDLPHPLPEGAQLRVTTSIQAGGHHDHFGTLEAGSEVTETVRMTVRYEVTLALAKLPGRTLNNTAPVADKRMRDAGYEIKDSVNRVSWDSANGHNKPKKFI